MFNNVEEIPDSIEKFSVLFLRPQKLLVIDLNSGGHSCYVRNGTDLAHLV